MLFLPEIPDRLTYRAIRRRYEHPSLFSLTGAIRGKPTRNARKILAGDMRRCKTQWFLIWIRLGLREMDKDEEGDDGERFLL